MQHLILTSGVAGFDAKRCAVEDVPRRISREPIVEEFIVVEIRAEICSILNTDERRGEHARQLPSLRRSSSAERVVVFKERVARGDGKHVEDRVVVPQQRREHLDALWPTRRFRDVRQNEVKTGAVADLHAGVIERPVLSQIVEDNGGDDIE